VSSITASKQGKGKTPVLIVAGAALALLITVVAWQIANRDDEAATTGTISTTTELTTGTSAVASDASTTPEAPMVYIVATDEEATRLRLALGEADAIRYQMGLPAMDVTVMVAATHDEHDQVLRFVAEINADRDGESLPAYRIVNLRGQQAAGEQPAPARYVPGEVPHLVP